MLKFRKWLACKLWPQQVNVVTQVSYSHRLTPELFTQLKSKLPVLYVDDNTSVMRGGFQLGMQKVLDVLAQDFTIQTA